MYFDPRPKNREEDLFNRENELKQFEDALPYASIIVITPTKYGILANRLMQEKKQRRSLLIDGCTASFIRKVNKDNVQ